MAFLLSTILISSLNAQLNCIEAPKDASCSLYKYPDSNSTQDTASLCSQMSFMVGCSVQKSCKSSTIGFCAPFSILGDICDGDMPRMKACKSYTSLCEITGTGDQATPSSPPIVGVQQCSSQPPIPSLPSSLLASQKIKSICSEMNMVGCDRCKDTGSTYMNCDLLDTYSYLCKAMPNMNQCAEWKQMCSLTPSLPFCSQDAATSPDSPPTMKMFFHTGLADYVLFEEWVPRTVLQYIGTVIALFFLCVFYEFLLAYHTVMEASWTMNKAALCFPYKLPGGQELSRNDEIGGPRGCLKCENGFTYGQRQTP